MSVSADASFVDGSEVDNESEVPSFGTLPADNVMLPAIVSLEEQPNALSRFLRLIISAICLTTRLSGR